VLPVPNLRRKTTQKERQQVLIKLNTAMRASEGSSCNIKKIGGSKLDISINVSIQLVLGQSADGVEQEKIR